MNGTVKQFLDALEEMREIYSFDDEKTRIVAYDIITQRENNCLQISTVDEKTGIHIHMSKNLRTEND